MKQRYSSHGSPLRDVREKMGKTQAVVAAELGLSKSTYSAWETGRIVLSAEHILKLAEYFSCTPNEIVGFVPRGAVGEGAATENTLRDDERLLLALYNALPPNNRASILDLMQSCSKMRRPRTNH